MSHLINWVSLYAGETSLSQRKGKSSVNAVTGFQDPPHHHEGKHSGRISGDFGKSACWQKAYWIGLMWLAYSAWPAFIGLTNSRLGLQEVEHFSVIAQVSLSSVLTHFLIIFLEDFTLKKCQGCQLKSVAVPKEKLQGDGKCPGRPDSSSDSSCCCFRFHFNLN